MPSNPFIDYLRRFNRKERFYLLGWALGNPQLALSDDFRKELSSIVGLAVPERDCFVAMDYHFNWIYAAACLSSPGAVHDDPPICVNPELDDGSGLRVIQGNQEDIDLVVAFPVGKQSHLLLIEAKGVTSWANKALDSKATRLRSIFGDSGRQFAHIQPQFVMASPLESRGLQPETWPSWMRGDKIAWLKMSVPDNLLIVSRCDKSGKVTKSGDHWRTRKEKTFREKTVTLQSEIIAP